MGSIVQFAGTNDFNGINWSLCNGEELSISRYPSLYSVIGNRFGGNGSSTFALPNLDTGNQTRYYICSMGTYA